MTPEDDFQSQQGLSFCSNVIVFLQQGRHSPFWLFSSEHGLSRACTRNHGDYGASESHDWFALVDILQLI